MCLLPLSLTTSWSGMGTYEVLRVRHTRMVCSISPLCSIATTQGVCVHTLKHTLLFNIMYFVYCAVCLQVSSICVHVESD